MPTSEGQTLELNAPVGKGRGKAHSVSIKDNAHVTIIREWHGVRAEHIVVTTRVLVDPEGCANERAVFLGDALIIVLTLGVDQMRSFLPWLWIPGNCIILLCFVAKLACWNDGSVTTGRRPGEHATLLTPEL